jgi:DNA-directed RNA polymerase alpha subunit
MDPRVQFNSDNNDILTFTLYGVNVSLANAIRRTILSDIKQVVFKTTPYEENKSNFIVNTTKLNNEILKQRLSCIPIYIKDYVNFPIKNYLVEVNVQNNTDIPVYVTTKDFTIKDIVTGKLLSETETKEIFPPDDYTGYYIDFAKLRPHVSEEIPGDKLHFTCEFSIGNSKDDSMFNVASTCSYGFTVDDVNRSIVLEKKKQEWKNENKSNEDIIFESENWRLLDGMRITKPDSFDFILQSVGVYTNNEILDMACDILIDKLDQLDTYLEKGELKINNSVNTMKNCYDIILENEDYTIGKVMEYLLYTKFYETKILTFCGFKKEHPHDDFSIIRIAYRDAVEKSSINGHFKECLESAKQLFTKIKKELLKLIKS